MRLFVPAAFELYEFDDARGDGSRAAATRRWFSHWDGLVGAPAEEVTLAWSDGRAMVLVCTSGHAYDVAEARSRTARLALGGDALPIPHRPDSPVATFAQIERIGRADASWRDIATFADDASRAEALVSAEFAVGYGRLGRLVVFVAATGLGPHRLRVRRLRHVDAYDLDATRSFPLSALNR